MAVRRHGRFLFFLLPLATVVALIEPAVAGAQPLAPSQDPFYQYSPSTLAGLSHGTILKSRSVDLSLGTYEPTPYEASQLLYVTTDQVGDPSATVTTVLVPTKIPLVPHIVEYLSFYDGLGSQCDPSYTLQGGDPGGSTNEQEADEEELLISWYLSQGDIVTIPDIEGSTALDWMAGRQSGYAALDAVVATEAYLHLAPTAEVGLSGYSGGSVAADWASELGSSYAPQVRMVGVAEGGIPVNYANVLAYVSGSSEYSAAIPGILIGLFRAYGVDLDDYLSSTGQQYVSQEQDVCIAQEFGTFTTTLQQMGLNLQNPTVEQILADQTMGMTGVPQEPLFMGVGDSDGTGDGVMVDADVQALAGKYCSEGVKVLFQEYKDASHETAGALFEPQTGPFLQERFEGVPFRGNCSPIGSRVLNDATGS